MRCSKCQFDNPEDSKFCRSCGVSLQVEITCPNCGSSHPKGSNFCNKCGQELRKPAEAPAIDYSQPQSYTPNYLAEKILKTRSSIEGERKLVTVLFADVANYTAIAEKLDPEEVHLIMDGCFAILMDEIHKFEGTINQFTGDGVMALFGAPVAHENHAQRACHAALSIQEAMGKYGEALKKDYGIDFEMRIGLNSGPVIVGSIGDDLRMDYTAVGDTTNLAARIQEIANPAQIYMSQETRSIVKDYFQDKSEGGVILKGKTVPQAIYRLVAEHPGVRTRFEAGLIRGVTELVGRRPELEALQTGYKRAKGGDAQIIDIVGEAGVGKSRLVYEFRKALEEDVSFLTGICVHHGRNINFLPVMDVVKAASNIEEGMTEREIRDRIEEKAKGKLAAMTPFYQNLLALTVDDSKFNSLDPEGRKLGTFEAVKDLLLVLSNEKPLVVFVEDVHWIDRISEEFFTYFSRCMLEHPILMLTAYRPEGSPPWTQGAHYQRLGLETLSSQSSVQLVRNVLGGLALDSELEQRVADRGEGNPFFIEEIVSDLTERGDLKKEGPRYLANRRAEELEIPSTIQAVLAARMDRLNEDLKRTVQVASVIGRYFAFRLLNNIMELGDELKAYLNNLVGLEILYEKALYPELEYIFKNALTQEVAYESLLKQRRREIHGRIARAIEELYEGNLEQHYELLAHHWELSDSPDRAIEYLVLAGEKSNRSLAADTAVDFFTRAQDLIEQSGQVPDSVLLIKIRSGRANPLHSMGKIEESFADYQEAIKLSEELGDQRKALDCLALVPLVIWGTKLKDKMPFFCNRGLELARILGDKGSEARIMTNYAFWRYVWQGTDEYGTLKAALELAEESGQAAAIGHIQLYLALLERWRGEARLALELTEGMVERLRSSFNIFHAGGSCFVRGMALTDVGNYDEATRFLSEWVDILEQHASYIQLARINNVLAWAYSEIYDLERAVRFNNRSTEINVELRKSPALLYIALELQAQAEVNIMENKFEMGRVDDAWEHLNRFHKTSKHPDWDFIRVRWLTRLKHLKGGILLNRGDLNGAEEIARDCLNVASQYGFKKYIGRAERLLGEISTKGGALEFAEEKLMRAVSILEEVGNPKQLWVTRSALAHLYNKMNRQDLEREQWNAAASIVKSTAEELQEEELRTTFLNAAPVREILNRAV